MTEVDNPRYIAFNSGQEAFQLFYERLLLIKSHHTKNSTFIRTNHFHLATIINTFNRHYCTGIGCENSFYGLTGDITPIFINLGLYTNPLHNLHRLLGIQLDCGLKYAPGADDIYFVFDNPAKLEGNFVIEKDGDTTRFGSLVFRISITDFSNTSYRHDVYLFERRDYGAPMNLKFDKENQNFEYGLVVAEVGMFIHNNICPPLFSNMYIEADHNDAFSLRCSDDAGLHNLQGRSGLFFGKPLYWTVPTQYIAHNRYRSQKKDNDHMSSTVNISAMEKNKAYRSILLFLFGLEDMIYVFINFKQLHYDAKLCLRKRDTDIGSITTGSHKEKLERVYELVNNAGYNGLYKQNQSFIDTIVITNNEKKVNIQIYINQYQQLNNYINMAHAATIAVERLVHDDKKLIWPLKTEKDLPELFFNVGDSSYDGESAAPVIVDANKEDINAYETNEILRYIELIDDFIKEINKRIQ